MDNNQSEVALRWMKGQIEEQKHDVFLLYAGLKLKLPKYLKTLTIEQLRGAGGTIDPDISLSKDTIKIFRSHSTYKGKLEELDAQIQDIIAHHKKQITLYFNNIKQQIPVEMRNKTLGELEDREWLVVNDAGFENVKLEK